MATFGTYQNGVMRNKQITAEDVQVKKLPDFIPHRRIGGDDIMNLADYIRFLEERIAKLESDFQNYIILEKK